MTNKAGILAYYEVCNKLKEGFVREWLDEQRVPIAYGEDEWVGYDDVQSLFEKVIFFKFFPFLLNLFTFYLFKVNYVKSKQLGGVFVNSLNLDDSTGHFCNQVNLFI